MFPVQRRHPQFPISSILHQRGAYFMGPTNGLTLLRWMTAMAPPRARHCIYPDQLLFFFVLSFLFDTIPDLFGGRSRFYKCYEWTAATWQEAAEIPFSTARAWGFILQFLF